MEIRVEEHGRHVVVVTLDNQPRLNAMTRAMMADLARLLACRLDRVLAWARPGGWAGRDDETRGEWSNKGGLRVLRSQTTRDREPRPRGRQRAWHPCVNGGSAHETRSGEIWHERPSWDVAAMLRQLSVMPDPSS